MPSVRTLYVSVSVSVCMYLFMYARALRRPTQGVRADPPTAIHAAGALYIYIWVCVYI